MAGAGGNVVSGGTQGTVVQAGHIEHLVVHQAPPPADEVTVAPPFGRRGAALRGREELTTRLLAASGTHVLYGLGGVGKTSLALEVADVLARDGAPVWWVAAQDAGRLAGGLRAVARRVGLDAEELAGGQTADLLWERLAALPGPWLLLLDNADDLALLDGPGSLAAGTGWVRAPAGAAGLVLVTTRDGDPAAWGSGPVLHRLGALPGPEGARVLVDRAGPDAGPATDAAALSVRLGGLPLALDSAGRYLASVAERPAFLRTPGEPATYSAYLDALGTGDVTVDGDGTLARIWAMSLRLLRDRGHAHAEELLRLLAGFADAPVPLRVFAPERVDIPPGELWTCLQALDRLGLAALRTDEEPVVSLHPLVRDAFRGERERLSAALAVTLDPPQAGGRLWELLVPHLLHDLDAGRTEDGWRAALLAVDSLEVRGMVRAVPSAARSVAEATVRALGPVHPLSLAARLAHGQALLDGGQAGQARVLLGELAADMAETLGPDAPDTLECRHTLAMAHHLCGDLDGAREVNARVLTARDRVLGPAHPATLTTRHNQAMVLVQLGDPAGALAEFDAILAAETAEMAEMAETAGTAGIAGTAGTAGSAAARGDALARTLVTRENRVHVLRMLGDTEGAREELQAVHDARVRLFGADHPTTLSARYNLATVLPPDRAREELTAVLDARTRVLGPDHPVTLATREALERTARTLPE
ncbi:tetratricopeptide repeat protein [Streptomyces roseoviridis]|uniref:Tetratricopeptide repeat protein n=1 Tax=Streptomyces roseoviridis TaxID=67361 RepID=A0ABV5QSI9_9ACTN